MSNVQRLLFVCSRNQWRSPTAERLFGRDPRFQVRSRGVSKKARRTICDDDIQWADLILVIEEGRIVERGKHEEMMELGGRYHRLQTLQARI